MSLTTIARPKKRLWPLAVFMVGLVTAVSAIWLYWPQILLQSVLWQKILNREMTQLLQQVAEHPHRAGLSLLAFSLVYGILHALGPGHGKVVITTFLATHPAKLKTSMKLTLLASLLQGSVAIVLVTLMLVVLHTSSRQLHLSSFWLEKGSYLLVIALGIWTGYRAVNSLWRLFRPKPAMNIRALHPHHHHDDQCGCGHAHLPSAQQVAGAVNVKTQLLVVLSMGLRPCSGAIMMLLFAKVIGVYLWGVLSAAVMAMGTALTISAIGLLVQRSRSLAQRLSANSHINDRARSLLPLLALLGSVMLIVAGCALWQSAQPGLAGGIRPF